VTSPSVFESLASAVDTTRSLHAEVEALTRQLLLFETHLLSQKLGVSAWVAQPQVSGDANPTIRLHFGKHGPKWGLFIEVLRPDEPSVWTPIQHTTRQHRIWAASVLAQLVESLLEKAQHDLAAARTAKHQVASLLTSLGATA